MTNDEIGFARENVLAQWRESMATVAGAAQTYAQGLELGWGAQDDTHEDPKSLATLRARVAANLDAGIVWVNCSQPTFTEAPWGGMKQSGIGRELGRWGLDNYLEVKQITAYTSCKPWGWYGS